MVFATSISLVAVVAAALTIVVAVHQPGVRLSASSQTNGKVLGVTAFSGTDADNDGYTSIPSGGSDCYDSLQAQYSDFPNSSNPCDSTDDARVTNLTTNIADHSWIKDNNGTWHLFFQDAVAGNHRIEHHTTTDFTNFTSVGYALAPTSGKFDSYGIWAPNVIKNPADGLYYMFYAGVTGAGSNPNADQRIGVATSSDLTTWTKVSDPGACSAPGGDGCVYECNNAWTTWGDNGQYDEQCRDPFVIWDSANSRWVMFTTVRFDATATGCVSTGQGINVATSTNLTSWTSQGYIKATCRYSGGTGAQTTGGISENPFVTAYDSTYYLWFNDYNDTEDAAGTPNARTQQQYATSATLTADASGSTNWTYRGYTPNPGVNATEIIQPQPDVWIMSQSMSNGNIGSQWSNRDLIWHRVVWGDTFTFTGSKLSNLSCRVASNTIKPGGTEICSDNVDQNCSGAADEALYCAASCTDADGDGYGVSGLYVCAKSTADTNDADAAIYPGATEICDGKDNDSDSQTDEGGVCTCTESWSCSSWSSCSNTTHTRTCTDANACGTTITKPATSETCTAITADSVAVTTSTTGAHVSWGTNQASDSRVRFGMTASYGSLASSSTMTTSHTITLSGLQPDTTYHYEVSSIGTTTVTSDDATFRTLAASSPSVTLPPAPQDEVIKTSVVVTGTKEDAAPSIKVFTVTGKLLKTFFAYSSFFGGGVNVAVGDVTGDGNDEIVTAPGPGGPPTIRIFDMNGKSMREDFAAFPGLFRNGINVTLVDLDGDRKKEIAVAPMSGAPQLRIFGLRNGRFLSVVPNIFAFARTMRSGLALGTSDLDADGLQEVLVTPGAGGKPLLRVFGLRNRVLKQIMADALVGPATSRTGMSVAGASVATGTPGIAAVSSDGSSLVRWFIRNSQGKLAHAAGTFLAFHPAFRGGANIAGCDLNADGLAELIAAVAGSGNPLIRIFDAKGKMAFPEFYAFPKSMKDGLTIACGQK